MWRVRDPVKGDDQAVFDEGVLDAPVVSVQARQGPHSASPHLCAWKRGADASTGAQRVTRSLFPCALETPAHNAWSRMAPARLQAHSDLVNNLKRTSGTNKTPQVLLLPACGVRRPAGRARQDLLAADAIVLGAPGRQGGMCGEMRLFLDSLAHLQVAGAGPSIGKLKVRPTQGPRVLQRDEAVPGLAGSPAGRRHGAQHRQAQGVLHYGTC